MRNDRLLKWHGYTTTANAERPHANNSASNIRNAKRFVYKVQSECSVCGVVYRHAKVTGPGRQRNAKLRVFVNHAWRSRFAPDRTTHHAKACVRANRAFCRTGSGAKETYSDRSTPPKI